MKPPDLERAFVRPEKITRYLLSEAHPVGRYNPGRVRIAYLYPDAGHDGTRCVPYGGTWRITGGATCRGAFFFTVVTERRAAILGNDLARDYLRTAFWDCRQRWPFRVDALVLPPSGRTVRITCCRNDVPRRIERSGPGSASHQRRPIPRPPCQSHPLPTSVG